MSEMTITNAQYITDLDGVKSTNKASVQWVQMWICIETTKRDYAENIGQVDAGEPNNEETEKRDSQERPRHKAHGRAT